MSTAKYELAGETQIWHGRTLHRIRALRDIDWWGVKAGDLGGWIERESNLAQAGNSWVFGAARVYGDAQVYGNARVSGNALVFDSAWVYGDAHVFDSARVSGNALVFDSAWVYGDAHVFDSALVSGNAWAYGDAWVSGNARVFGAALVSGNAWVYGDAWVFGAARVYGNALVSGNAQVSDSRDLLVVGPVGSEHRCVTIHRTAPTEKHPHAHQINAGCWTGTVDQLAERIAKPKTAWPDSDKRARQRWKNDYEAVIACALTRINEWNEVAK